MKLSGFGLIVTLALGLPAALLDAAAAQRPEKVPRVGYLNPGSPF